MPGGISGILNFAWDTRSISTNSRRDIENASP
jgi:hypothetical protein